MALNFVSIPFAQCGRHKSSDFILDSDSGKPSNPYSFLLIEPTTNQDIIKRAYRVQAMKFHPDRMPKSNLVEISRSEVLFKKFKSAYEYLKEPAQALIAYRKYSTMQASDSKIVESEVEPIFPRVDLELSRDEFLVKVNEQLSFGRKILAILKLSPTELLYYRTQVKLEKTYRWIQFKKSAIAEVRRTQVPEYLSLEDQFLQLETLIRLAIHPEFKDQLYEEYNTSITSFDRFFEGSIRNFFYRAREISPETHLDYFSQLMSIITDPNTKSQKDFADRIYYLSILPWNTIPLSRKFSNSQIGLEIDLIFFINRIFLVLSNSENSQVQFKRLSNFIINIITKKKSERFNQILLNYLNKDNLLSLFRFNLAILQEIDYLLKSIKGISVSEKNKSLANSILMKFNLEKSEYSSMLKSVKIHSKTLESITCKNVFGR